MCQPSLAAATQKERDTNEGSMPSWHLVAALVALSLFLQFREYAFRVLFASVAPLAIALPIALLLRKRKQRSVSANHSQASKVGSTEDTQDAEDNVRWSFMPSTGVYRTNMTEAVRSENDFAKCSFVVLHRPTHNKALDESGAWRYGWHFEGRKRIWEVRCQVQFREKPRGQVFFGLEMATGQEKCSGYAAKVKTLILGAIGTAVGKDFYQTAGDPPNAKVDELEPPVFVMPLWAIDQFHVANPGEEPDMTGDLNGVGRRRTEGLKVYKQAMNELVKNIDVNKVYTLCFWGVSQFIDVNMWEFKGWTSMMKMDATKLSGPPPLYVVCYDFIGRSATAGSQEPQQEQKHLISLKNYYFKVALWSNRRPPDPTTLRQTLGLSDEALVDGDGRLTAATNNGNGCFARLFTPDLEREGRNRSGRQRHKEKNWFLQAHHKAQQMFGGCLGERS